MEKLTFSTLNLTLSVLLSLLMGFLVGGVFMAHSSKLEVRALHAQIEKQNCEENTIPRLRKELLGR